MKYNRLLAQSVRELQARGLHPEISNGGKHLHLCFVNSHGVACRLVFSRSLKTNRRAGKYTRAELRRLLRAQNF